MNKLYILVTLMNAYFNVGKEDRKNIDELIFVKENVSQNVMQENIEQYEEVLDDLTLYVDNTSKLLDEGNRASLIALVAYSFVNDIDLDDWIVDFFRRNHTYIRNQKENCIYMKNDLEGWRKCSVLKVI